MADETVIIDPAAHNAEVAAKLAAQDITGKTTTPDPADLEFSGAALDKLAEEREAAKKKAAEEVKPDIDPVNTSSDADEAAKKAAEEAAKKAAEEAAKKKTADEEQLKKADEIFKGTQTLPPNASPKSVDAFNGIKIRASQEIGALSSKLEEATKKLAELEEKAKNPLTPEVEKELEDLRSWRAKLDVEVDPKFKEHDKTIDSSREFVYAQLRKSPVVTDKVIEEIKKHGGPDKVDLTKLFAAMEDPMAQRLVEAKLADIEMAKYAKQQAIQAAKDNIKGYLSEKQKAWEATTTAHNAETKKHFESLSGKLDWFQVKTPDAKADDATKKSVEEHNKFVEETRKQLDAAYNDDSPEMRAIMLTGMAQLFHLQRLHGAVSAENATLKKSLEEANAKIEKMKSSITSRLPESGAPRNGKMPVEKKDPDFSQRADIALDDLAKNMMEERARARAGA